ncbi:TatD family hydrolase [Lentisalinibacter sediminis]|uniref:TatD family hydrolase n=1 Tax=Lentisalinibacter sediminis TaxID=2992237 RepID=UPI003870E041
MHPLDLIDIGANLAHDSFDDDREAVLERAAAAGVRRIVVTGSSVESSERAADLAAVWPGRLFATAGMHPHHADDWHESVRDALLAVTARPGVVSMGECGLDYFRNYSSHENQRRAFAEQLELAARTGLPVFLHQRDAHADFLEVLTPRLPDLTRAVAHCFTAGEAELEAYLELGLYIGITGWICDERRGLHLRELVPRIPADKLLLETDAPYLLPRTIRPRPKTRRNEPGWLPWVLETVAGARGVSPEELARQTTANAERFFDLPGDGH